MVNEWIRIPPEVVAKHPLNGIRGWLLLFGFSQFLGVLKDLASIANEANIIGISLTTLLSIDSQQVSFIKGSFIIQLAAAALVLLLMFTRHPNFRQGSTLILLLWWPAIALFGSLFEFEGLGSTLGITFISWILYCLVWVTYLQRSERVRITFEHMSRVPKGIQSKGFQIPASFSYSVTEGQTKSSESTDSPIQFRQSQENAPQVQERSLIEEKNLDEIYARIALEIESENVDKGLWTRLYAECDGDEIKVKVAYIKARAKKLTTLDGAAEKANTPVVLDASPSTQAQSSEIERQSVRTSAASVAEKPSTRQNPAGETSADTIFYNSKSSFSDSGQATTTPHDLKRKFLEGTSLYADEVIRLVSSEIIDADLLCAHEPFRGDTLLHIAASYNLKSAVVKLLEMGASPSVHNGQGKAPFMVTQDVEIKNLLLK